MTKAPFLVALVRKSARALQGARLALDGGDNDSAVSRCYYAMFDIARAALLRAGVPEDKLPRTHNGVIEAFRRHAVESGRIHRQFATQLTRTESLRIQADYTGTEIEFAEATEVMQNAEVFVQTVRHAYQLTEDSTPNGDDKVSEPCARENLEPIVLEDLRRQARENWLQLQRRR